MPEKKTNFQKWKDDWSFSDFVSHCRSDCLNCPLFGGCLIFGKVNCLDVLADWAFAKSED